MTWMPKADCSWLLKSMVKCRGNLVQTQYWNEVVQTGNYHTTKMYRSLRGVKQQVPWRKIMYKNYARPRAPFNLWMTLMGRKTPKRESSSLALSLIRNCILSGEGKYRTIFFMLHHKTNMGRYSELDGIPTTVQGLERRDAVVD